MKETPVPTSGMRPRAEKGIWRSENRGIVRACNMLQGLKHSQDESEARTMSARPIHEAATPMAGPLLFAITSVENRDSKSSPRHPQSKHKQLRVLDKGTTDE